jgi:hypothetical protein
MDPVVSAIAGLLGVQHLAEVFGASTSTITRLEGVAAIQTALEAAAVDFSITDRE